MKTLDKSKVINAINDEMHNNSLNDFATNPYTGSNISENNSANTAFLCNGTIGDESSTLVTVCLLNLPFYADNCFDYLVDNDSDVDVGDFVLVPFGKGNRTENALVLKKYVTNSKANNYKKVYTVCSKIFSLNEEMILLVEFLKEYTFCTYGDAIRAVTPSYAFSKFKEILYCREDKVPFLTKNSLEDRVYNHIKENGKVLKNDVISLFSPRAKEVVNRLVNEGFLVLELQVNEKSNIKYLTHYSLNFPEKEIEQVLTGKLVRSEAQKRIVTFVAENVIVEHGYLQKTLNVTSSQLKTLVLNGILKSEKTEQYRTPYILKKSKTTITLNDSQQAAAKKIISLTQNEKPQASLLYGITGSGKTQVIKEVIDKVVASGRGVIVLVPEISLTPQTISVFAPYYGERTALIHSALSAGERFDAWRKIKRGEIDVCIGTRSAIFAPFENLGLIVIDEEQEHTYKSDSSPKYHARDIASFRCGKHNALMLLASATPSLESYYKAKQGIYTLVELNERFGNAVLPSAEVLDMRYEAISGNLSLFSQKLVNAIKDNLEKNLQSVLFLNRRGYHSFMSCISCGYAISCPHCSVSLTHHTSRFRQHGYLSCHYCGYSCDIPTVCPNCKKNKMKFLGFGTQMAQEQLKKIFPEAKIARMDADTTTTKLSYDEILNDFRLRKTDILIGTQMVTKGHDFPYVTLVGMLCADQSLHLDDYRANERTFSAICQTAGRAGRAEHNGTALIQCYNPEHSVLEYARKQDYPSFYKTEIDIRKNFLFPPFCDIAAITISANNEEDCIDFATKICNYLKQKVNEDKKIQMQFFGPFEAPVYKLNDKYRYRIIIKFKNSKKHRALFRETIITYSKNSPPNTNIALDINPNTI